MNDSRFERDVLTAFDFLAPTVPPRVLYSDSDSAASGNAQLGIEYDQFRLRVTRDRGQVFVDLSPRWVAADWFDEDVIVELVAGRDAAARLEANLARPLADAADGIRMHLAAIVECFRDVPWPTTRAALRKLQEARAQRLFG
jgi:hypothetical protein